METVSIKLDEDFARRIERIMKQQHYVTKSEYIREALRQKVLAAELGERLRRVRKDLGIPKRRTTDAQLHAAGEKAVEELERELL
ncbi:MAG: ribbon-helix-helix domain-containing protein [Nanoarchaeota archaeon]